MRIDLTGKNIIVTGASSGIGAATAKELAGAGAAVVAVGRDRGRLDAVVTEIRSNGGRATAVIADLGDEQGPEQVVAAATGEADGVDGLVHVGGHFVNTPLGETPLEQLDDLWRVHVRGPFALTQAIVPHLREGSSLIFFSSTVVRAGFAPYAAYTAVKGAVDAMARSLASELAPRTRVNTILPGFTRTPMMTDQFAEVPELEGAIVARTPVGAMEGPDSAASLVTLLCSDRAAYVHGAGIVVDGGWTAAGWQAG